MQSNHRVPHKVGPVKNQFMPRTGRLITGVVISLAPKVSLEITRALPPFEFSTFLVRVAHVAELVANFYCRVPYHEACRSLGALRRQQEPRVRLPHVRGFELIEMPFGLSCCGYGGRLTTKIDMISAATGEAAKAENRGAAFPAPTDAAA